MDKIKELILEHMRQIKNDYGTVLSSIDPTADGTDDDYSLGMVTAHILAMTRLKDILETIEEMEDEETINWAMGPQGEQDDRAQFENLAKVFHGADERKKL